MRHKKKRATQLSAGAQKRSLVIRNLITSLVLHGSIQTTSKRAKALQVFADSFFSKLTKCYDQYQGDAIRREVIRRVKEMITVDAAGIKLVDDLLPKRNDEKKSFGFVRTLKVGNRVGDNAQKVLVSIK